MFFSSIYLVDGGYSAEKNVYVSFNNVNDGK